MNAGYNTMFKMLKAFSSIAKIGNPYISFIQILRNSVLLSSCNQHFVLLTLDLNTDNECRADNTHLKKGGHRNVPHHGWEMKKILKSASSKTALEG